MERTPSPPRRLHTPPAPQHGHNYEPFSPRRSTRVAAQRDLSLHHEHNSPRARRDVTPTASSKRKATARISNFTLSPPSSPISSPQHRSPRSTRRAHPEVHALDSDSDHMAPTPARRFRSIMGPGMLPTPASAPRKRALQTEASLSTTARVLFPQRHATIDEVVPTPRKARKTKNLFSLESFEQNAHGESSEKIQIFTDSKERIPTRDDEEDNPFVTKKGKGRARAIPQKSKKHDARTEAMSDAVDRDEGMVYLFRGKKVFRKFHDGPPSNASATSHNDEELPVDERVLQRQIGPDARRPLTRSSIKPRLLFQEEIKERNRQNGHDEDDEEADTEIEAYAATPSRRKGKAVIHLTEAPADATPPPTVRKAKREISFDSWSRVKSAHGSGGSTRESKKRGGEPLEREADKRARSEHSTSSMSLDNF
ncbi:hypothetical protein FB567DRAFT_627845 [Paraphoma chrysanthemicola]|uniref:Uncharacterized protein n=1 Tax=Paraphoma chrysanthemicola TaxID=798071 RepID=A0A8K0R6I2_9PLEO|nr:hypothetical protein FB567DRAFT_627845 [Paraphoma chrysanthemicola]